MSGTYRWGETGVDDQVAAVLHHLSGALGIESAVMPLDESVAITRTLDAVRAETGLAFPGEVP
jgi:hypothetical protein